MGGLKSPEEEKLRWWREVCELAYANKEAIREAYKAIDPFPACGVLAMACELSRGDTKTGRKPVDLRLLLSKWPSKE
jgi:hypothetical protein